MCARDSCFCVRSVNFNLEKIHRRYSSIFGIRLRLVYFSLRQPKTMVSYNLPLSTQIVLLQPLVVLRTGRFDSNDLWPTFSSMFLFVCFFSFHSRCLFWFIYFLSETFVYVIRTFLFYFSSRVKNRITIYFFFVRFRNGSMTFRRLFLFVLFLIVRVQEKQTPAIFKKCFD